MGLFSNPLGHAGYPPGVTGTPTTQPSAVRAATAAEAADGVLTDVYISPATAQSATALDFASPPVTGYGSTTPRPVASTTLTSSGATTIGAGVGVPVAIGNSTGNLGFFGASGAARVSQAAITNSVASGGTTGTIANFTDLSTYATDAPTIRNDIYQLALALSNVITALRAYGLLA